MFLEFNTKENKKKNIQKPICNVMYTYQFNAMFGFHF